MCTDADLTWTGSGLLETYYVCSAEQDARRLQYCTCNQHVLRHGMDSSTLSMLLTGGSFLDSVALKSSLSCNLFSCHAMTAWKSPMLRTYAIQLLGTSVFSSSDPICYTHGPSPSASDWPLPRCQLESFHLARQVRSPCPFFFALDMPRAIRPPFTSVIAWPQGIVHMPR